MGIMYRIMGQGSQEGEAEGGDDGMLRENT